jgi:hypothetical protein
MFSFEVGKSKLGRESLRYRYNFVGCSAKFGEKSSLPTFISIFIMDHGKPHAVLPQIFDFSGEPTMSVNDSDLHYDRPPSFEEPARVIEKRERQGESVW